MAVLLGDEAILSAKHSELHHPLPKIYWDPVTKKPVLGTRAGFIANQGAQGTLVIAKCY